VAFSVPMLVGNLLQIGYSIVNMMWVGKMVGADAVGATAVSAPLVFIMLALVNGLTLATTILVSQHYGAKDHASVARVVSNSFALTLFVGIAITILGILSCDLLLRMMDTPAEIFAMASSYLKITILGFVLTYYVNLVVAILRGIGDTVTPLIFQAIGLAINAILDPLMIIGIGPFPRLGLNGAAWASMIALGIAFALALIYLNRKGHVAAINPRRFRLDWGITRKLLQIGLPSAIQQSLVSIGSAFITTFVNGYGASANAAYGAAGRIDAVAFMPAMTMSLSASALAGQNIGARRLERIREVFWWGVLMTSLITIAVSLCAVLLRRPLLSFFVDDPQVLDIGAAYLRIEGASYILFAVMFISNGIINGSGHTLMTMIFTLVSLWMVRVPLSAVLTRTPLGITGIWIAIVISYGVTMAVSLAYYFSGRWKKLVVRTRKAMAPQGAPPRAE
jgi:putative MATE family efflux protein